MKKFIIDLLLFISLCLLIVSSSIIVLNSTIDKKAVFKIKANSTHLILGHSHPECAFNDSLITNFSNYARSGESYFYTFIKIKKIAEQNKNVKAIFLEFSNDQIDAEKNEWIWGNVFLSRYYHEYSPFMNVEDNTVILKNNPSGWLNGLRVSLKKNFKNLAQNEFNYLNGGYFYLVRDKIDSLLKNRINIKTDSSANSEFSFINIKYLDKIISYCKEKKVTLYLVRSPVHPESEKYNNEKDFINLVASRYSETEFLDFSRFPLSTSDFGDPEHLNYRGARKFSIWFNELIDQGLLNKSNKQLIIIEKMKEKQSQGNRPTLPSMEVQ